MYTQFEENDRKIFWVFLAACATALVGYVYFVGVSVYAVVDRKSAEESAERLLAHISILESQYVVLDKRINLDLARSEGFLDVAVPRYITQELSGDTLTLRDSTGNRP